MPNEIPADELRRELRDLAAASDATRKPFRELMLRVFAGRDGRDLPTGAKAALVGVDRRTLLAAGGTLAATTALAACAKPNTGEGETGIPRVGVTTTTLAMPKVPEATDLILLETGSSIELLAVETYETALATGLITDAVLRDAALLFQQQHREHAQVFAEATTAAGGTPYTEPNAVLKARVIDAALEEVTDQESAAALAWTLEGVAAQSYQRWVELLQSAQLRQTVTSIGVIEARHQTVLSAFLTQLPAQDPATEIRDVSALDLAVPSAFQGVGLAVGPASWIVPPETTTTAAAS